MASPPPSPQPNHRLQPSWARLVGANAVVCGLEISTSVAFTYLPPLLLKAGFGETAMSSILGVGPFLALFSVPLMGRWSDQCNCALGRRRPFILFLCLVVLLSMLLVPCGQLMIATAPRASGAMLAVGGILLDYGSQAAFNPCEALVSDMVGDDDDGPQQQSSADQADRGFQVYSSMISLGSCLGYLVTALDWESLGLSVGTQEQTAFLLIALLFLACTVTTMVAAPERRHVHIEGMDSVATISPPNLSIAQPIPPANAAHTILRNGWLSQKTGLLPSVALKRLKMQMGAAYVAGTKRTLRTMMGLLGRVVLVPLHVYRDIWNSPTALKRLFCADFVSWTAVMCHAMFYTDFVGQAVFKGHPEAVAGSPEQHLYDLGVRTGSWGLLWRSVASCLYAAVFQDLLREFLGLRWTYVLGLATFPAAMLGTLLMGPTMSTPGLHAFCALSGLSFAVVTTTPNSLVTMYNTHPALYFPDAKSSRGMAADIAVLDAAYYLAQIALSLTIGSLVDLTGSLYLSMITAGVVGILAVYAATRVVFAPLVPVSTDNV